mmetsp:Transcript_29852/g.92379  ORF Transcript_29852/g.92379 Transcript_29852/m.92379 type:complete len:93 (-) Transcript_29852:1806-2084(-)
MGTNHMGCQLFIEERVNYVLKDAENIKALEDRIRELNVVCKCGARIVPGATQHVTLRRQKHRISSVRQSDLQQQQPRIVREEMSQYPPSKLR